MKGEGATTLEAVGEFEGGASWIAYPGEQMQRASHVLVDGEDLWLVDPVDADDLDQLLAELGTVAGIVLLLDRHKRDAADIARRHDVAVHLPKQLAAEGAKLDAQFETFEGRLADTGYRTIEVLDRFFWHEVALFDPDSGTLVVPEALGTAPYFCTASEDLGVHPALRMFPPRGALGSLDPERILVGHGAPVLEDASEALRTALSNSRSGAPGLYARTVRAALPV